MCPNCHSQTPTFRRGSKKVDYNGKEFKNIVESSYSINEVCNRLNISIDANYNTIRKKINEQEIKLKKERSNS